MDDQIIPRVAWLTVNRNCNFRCVWCYAKGTSYNIEEEMSLELAKKLTMLVIEAGVKQINIIGGEPTLWKPLLEFNRFCKNLEVKITLVTNAMRFSDDTFWEKYQESPNDSIGISLKAHNKMSLKSIAGITDFEKMKLGIKRGVNLNEGGVQVVYNTLNVDDLVNVALFAKECDARWLGIGFCTPAIDKIKADGKYMIRPSLLVSNILENYEELSKITNGKINFSMKLPLCLWPEDFINTLVQKKQIMAVCQLQKRSGVIFSENGDLTLCNSLFDYPIAKYGKEFVDGPGLLKFLNTQDVFGFYDRLNKYPSDKCIDCKMYEYCGGGCVMYWTVYNARQVIKGYK